MKKRFICALLLCSLSLVLFSCGESTPKDNSSTSTATSSSKNTTSTSTSKIEKDKSARSNKDDTNTISKSESNTPTINSNVSKNESSSSSKKEVDQEIRLYVYDAISGESMYTMKNITIVDGALVSAIINALKDDSSNNFTALNPEIQVKSAKLEKDKDLLTVDFGEKFLNNMDLGGGVEMGMLQSVVNSLGYNFGVSNVCITVNGEGYSSGHVSHKADEPFKVDYSNSIPLK
ncbi:MAG: GerMN domain-containing protein [Clostridium sp.]|nr:GerMN domain-containing protein [Clostridium sp.]MCI7441905.1 GerMN domain-containing protein [Clostridium sp.]